MYGKEPDRPKGCLPISIPLYAIQRFLYELNRQKYVGFDADSADDHSRFVQDLFDNPEADLGYLRTHEPQIFFALMSRWKDGDISKGEVYVRLQTSSPGFSHEDWKTLCYFLKQRAQKELLNL